MALSWWIISMVIALVFIFIFKSQDVINLLVVIKKNLFLFLIIGLVLFVGFSIYRISTTYHVDFTSYEGIVKGGKLYFLWIKSLFGNFGKITGYAVGQDWVLNSTNITK